MGFLLRRRIGRRRRSVERVARMLLELERLGAGSRTLPQRRDGRVVVVVGRSH
jgi:hypothetical protein